MTYKTIYASPEENISVQRTDKYLYIRANSPDSESDWPLTIAIPADKIETFLEKLSSIATAPEWTRANFIRVTPHNPRRPSYTMYRVDAEKWLHEDGRHITDSELARHHVDITVLA